MQQKYNDEDINIKTAKFPVLILFKKINGKK